MEAEVTKTKSSFLVRKGFCVTDFIAPFIFLSFFCAYLHMAVHSVNVPDESLYLNFAHRFFMGDCPVVDEWGVEQLTGMLLLIPFSVYYGITHTTEGIILFFRILYSVCQILVASYIYFSLWRYGNRIYDNKTGRGLFSIGALVAAVVFLCFVPLLIPTLSYYSMSLMGLAVLSVTLFCYPPSRFKYYFCGLVFAAVILAEPETILLHVLLLAVLLVIRWINRCSGRQTARHLFEDRFLLYLNCGGYTMAIAFFIFVHFRSGIMVFFKSFMHLFDGTGYDFSITHGNILDKNLFHRSLSLYGGVTMCVLLVLTVLAVILYQYRKKTRVVFAGCLLVFIVAASIHSWMQTMDSDIGFDGFCLYHGLPLYLSGPIWMLLAEKADRRLSCAWFVCASFSVLFSLSSRIAVGWGGIAAGIFSVMLATQVVIEVAISAPKKKGARKIRINQSKREKKRNLTAIALVTAFCLTVLCGEVAWFWAQNRVYGVEMIYCADPGSSIELNVRISDGPCRGIYTTQKVNDIYNSLIADVELIRNETSVGQSVYIHNRAPLCYIALDRSYGTFSTWFRGDEFYRIKQYWTEHPDKIPSYVYLPYYKMYGYERYGDDSLEQQYAEMAEVFQFEEINGQAGTILHIVGVLL